MNYISKDLRVQLDHKRERSAKLELLTDQLALSVRQEKERLDRRTCVFCKCFIDGTVYIYRKKRLHAACFDVMSERLTTTGQYNPRQPVHANGQLLSMGG